ncbi:MAG TPA: mechanosensitive ion channel family protein [bacterium]|nr:mechanosensitive ion channel family protein [bacterium]
MNDLNPFDTVFEPLHHWLRGLPWWQALGIFFFYVAFLFALQWVFFHSLRVLARKRSSNWLSLVADSFQRTIVIFLLSGTIGLLPLVLKVPRDFRRYFSHAAELLAALAIAIFIHKLLLEAYRRYVLKEEGRADSKLIRVMIAVAVYSVFLMVFLETAGISITPLIASLGVGSVAVAFALQQTLASLFAGLFILTDRPVRLGDFVKLESGEEGFIESIGWRSVRVRSQPNTVIIIPNSKIVSDVVTNYSLPDREIILSVEVGVDYASDLDRVEQVTLEVAREVLTLIPEAVSSFKPAVRWKGFGDSAIQLAAFLKAKDFIGQFAVRNAFIKSLHKRYRAEGIGIPFPIRTVYQKTIS